jgi:hypothetical protein
MSRMTVNPIDELIKAVQIVHGKESADVVRHALAGINEEAQKVWTLERFQQVLDNEIKYKDWRFIVQRRPIANMHESDFRLRVEWMGVDSVTGKVERQQSRWWPLSIHMVKTEVIQTAFLCVMKAEEHELRETFKYKDRAVFNTHINVNTLWGMAEKVDVRTDIRPAAPGNQRRE